ncbi:hypothetical protein [Bacillus sp. B1-b2]|uniref:hypothetical protein n=1 Tax=Bacillus sp. B1-b2 TaxID=2653201 RepID=UPI0012617BB4|nr:hypothetical protein [Bacillus sp. B1-b2]KAB7664809.1 hypothetical protein F9279_22760 [Bacillus sp. B1-b2]
MNRNIWVGFLIGIAAVLIIGVGIMFFGDYSIQKASAESNVEEKSESSDVEDMEEIEETKDMEETNEVVDSNNSISYSLKDNTITLTTEDGAKHIFESYSDQVDYTASQEKILINPQYGWEVGGALYTYSKEDGLKEIINVRGSAGEGEYYPSDAIWLDNRYIMYINSYLYGTIPSGDVQIYDTERGRIMPLDLYKGDAVLNLTSVSAGKHPYIVMSGIEFTDNSYMDNINYVEHHTIDEILGMIAE